MLFDWLVWSSNEILLMVIGSCFNQFTPSSGAMSFLCAMSIGSFAVVFDVCPYFPQEFDFILVHVLVSFIQWVHIFLIV